MMPLCHAATERSFMCTSGAMRDEDEAEEPACVEDGRGRSALLLLLLAVVLPAGGRLLTMALLRLTPPPGVSEPPLGGASWRRP